MITLAIILKNQTRKAQKSPSDREELVKRWMKKCGWLYGQVLAMGEVLMFVRENIAQLVGQALGVAYPGIDVGVRMSVYPIVYAAIGDIVLQLYGERHVCLLP